jgi:hypothetical protein
MNDWINAEPNRDMLREGGAWISGCQPRSHQSGPKPTHTNHWWTLLPYSYLGEWATKLGAQAADEEMSGISERCFLCTVLRAATIVYFPWWPENKDLRRERESESDFVK